MQIILESLRHWNIFFIDITQTILVEPVVLKSCYSDWTFETMHLT